MPAGPTRAVLRQSLLVLGSDVPLLPLRPDTGAGFPGSLHLSPQLMLTGIDGTGKALGRSLGLTWGPFNAIQFLLTRAESAQLPSADQSIAPRQVLPGTTVYDYRGNAQVMVDRVIGGAHLRAQSDSLLSLGATFDQGSARGHLAFRLQYDAATGKNPVVSLSEPSPVAEQAFPDRFVRNAAGHLLQVDSRPFNAVQNTRRDLSASFSFSRTRAGRGGMAMPDTGTAAHAVRAGRPLTWSVDFQAQIAPANTLVLRPGTVAIDLLRRPLALSSAPPARQRWTMRATLGSRRQGADVALIWSSGAQARAASGEDFAMRTAPLAKINLGAFWAVVPPWRTATAGAVREGRVRLLIDNLFDTRPDVRTTRAGQEVRLDPWVLDPQGRTVRVELRLPL